MSLIHELDAMESGCPVACFNANADELAEKHGCVAMVANYCGPMGRRNRDVRLSIALPGAGGVTYRTFTRKAMKQFSGTTLEFFDRQITAALHFRNVFKI